MVKTAALKSTALGEAAAKTEDALASLLCPAHRR